MREETVVREEAISAAVLARGVALERRVSSSVSSVRSFEDLLAIFLVDRRTRSVARQDGRDSWRGKMARWWSYLFLGAAVSIFCAAYGLAVRWEPA